MLDPQLHQSKPEQEIRIQAQKEYKLLGRIKINRGHSLFAFNVKTATLKKVELKKDVVLTTKGDKVKRSKVFQEPDTIYIAALNAKNALKKILKHYNNSKNQNHEKV